MSIFAANYVKYFLNGRPMQYGHGYY